MLSSVCRVASVLAAKDDEHNLKAGWRLEALTQTGSLGRMLKAMPPRGPAIAKFLRDALARDDVGVPTLEVMARRAGLLGEHQRITHAKLFRAAKKTLGIRSLRGFGIS